MNFPSLPKRVKQLLQHAVSCRPSRAPLSPAPHVIVVVVLHQLSFIAEHLTVVLQHPLQATLQVDLLAVQRDMDVGGGTARPWLLLDPPIGCSASGHEAGAPTAGAGTRGRVSRSHDGVIKRDGAELKSDERGTYPAWRTGGGHQARAGVDKR